VTQQYPSNSNSNSHSASMTNGNGNGGGGSGVGGGNNRGPDYVYFERRPGQFSDQTMGKAMAAKMKLELYYKEAVEGVVGRKERSVCHRSTTQPLFPYLPLPTSFYLACFPLAEAEVSANHGGSRRTTLEKQLAADGLTPDTLKTRQLLALGRRESK